MFGEQNDLSDVLGDVRQCAVHRRERGHRLPANRDSGGEVIGAKLAERADEREPTVVPQRHDGGALRVGGDNELGIAIPRWLLAIRREEIGPTRHEVSADVLHEDGDAVRLGIDRAKEVVIRHLGERSLGELALPLEREQSVSENGGTQRVGAGGHGWLRCVKMRLRQ